MPEYVKKTFVIFTYFVLILGAFLVFWQVRSFDFAKYDDNDYVYENPHVLNGLTHDGIIWRLQPATSDTNKSPIGG
jgi:hypothetical protein